MRGDGLYRRPKSPFWYFKLKENGRWREVSTKETNYQEARKVRRDKLAEQQAGLSPDAEVGRWPFERAADAYLENKGLHVTPQTVLKERDWLNRPKNAFGKLACDKITATHLRSLQRDIKDTGLKDTFNNLVLGVVGRVLKFAKVWRRIEADYCRIKERTIPAGKVLTAEEETRLFQTAAMRSDWTVAYAAALIAASTTCRGCELKSLRWKHVDLMNRVASIPDSKTAEGVRLVALNPDAVAGFRLLWARSAKVQGTDPEHYVFPACENWHFDPTRPQKSWITSWRTLRRSAQTLAVTEQALTRPSLFATPEARTNLERMKNEMRIKDINRWLEEKAPDLAGECGKGLAVFRFHDCRFLAITKLGEVGVPDQVIMAQAGHVSKRMLDYYSKARLKAKQDAVNSMAPILPRHDEMSTLRPN